jgi:hypothetical protein
MRVAVTGAYGFSGKYMARRLLDLRHEVITLTNSPHRSNPFGESIKAFLRAARARKIAPRRLRKGEVRRLVEPYPIGIHQDIEGVRVLGWIVRDVINTYDEVRGLMQERLCVDSPPLGTTKLSDWVLVLVHVTLVRAPAHPLRFRRQVPIVWVAFYGQPSVDLALAAPRPIISSLELEA